MPDTAKDTFHPYRCSKCHTPYDYRTEAKDCCNAPVEVVSPPERRTEATFDETPDSIARRMTMAKYPNYYNEPNYGYGEARRKQLYEHGRPINCPLWITGYFNGVEDAVKELRRG